MPKSNSFWDHTLETLEEALSIRKQIAVLETKLNNLFGNHPPSLAASVKHATRRTMSAAGRARIAAAARLRWAKIKGTASKAIKSVRAASGKKGTISAAGRARIAAAQRARWAKIKKGASVQPKKKGGLTPAGRARLAASMKARWAAKKSGLASGNKPKKKSGLTPEGRAKLAAAMKARWAAKKKGAAAPNSPAS